MVSHELRNPLATTKNALAGAQDPKASAAQRELFLSMMERQTVQMSDVLNDLLDVARIDRGQITIAPSPINLKQCVEEAMAQARPIAERKGQHVLLDAADDVYTNLDKTRIMQVLRNLVDNACKYSPHDASIRLELVPGDPILIRISDDGPGIPRDLLPHLFEFARPRRHEAPSRAAWAWGCRLPRSWSSCTGGTIEASNNAGAPGACFTVLLPAIGRPAPAPGT
jgi:signal transduction histidine kinase